MHEEIDWKGNVMLTLILATTGLTLLYGLSWHNQPAIQREGAQNNDNQNVKLRAVLGLKGSSDAARRHAFPAGQIVRGESNKTQTHGTADSMTPHVEAGTLAHPMIT